MQRVSPKKLQSTMYLQRIEMACETEKGASEVLDKHSISAMPHDHADISTY